MDLAPDLLTGHIAQPFTIEQTRQPSRTLPEPRISRHDPIRPLGRANPLSKNERIVSWSLVSSHTLTSKSKSRTSHDVQLHPALDEVVLIPLDGLVSERPVDEPQQSGCISGVELGDAVVRCECLFRYKPVSGLLKRRVLPLHL